LENEDSKNGTAFGNNGKNQTGVTQRFQRCRKHPVLDPGFTVCWKTLILGWRSALSASIKP